MSDISYEIRAMDLAAHEFCLRCRVERPASFGQRVALPAWIPGSYMIRDFARNIISMTASDERGVVALHKRDKQTWEAGACEGALVLDYRVYAFDLSVRSAYLDVTRGYFNGTSLFVVPPDLLDASWRLRIERPKDPAATNWRVATTLPPADVDNLGFGWYAGDGYARLIDHPVEIGIFESTSFTVDDIPHEIVVTEGGRTDLPRIGRDLKEICGEHAAMFGKLPLQRYLFLTLATADGYGGLEHSDSTSLICKRGDLPRVGLTNPDRGYRQFLGLCSHEYFHLWNVKRIRPARFVEPDLGHEVHTELLWAFEGITSYYDDLALVRSRVLPRDDYLDQFAATVTRVLRSPGRLLQSVAESSFDAWTKFYKQDENAPNAIVSYYTKGALVAFGLDMTMRTESGGHLSLDDLMRRLWTRFGVTGEGVDERGIEREAEALLGSPMDEFFADYVYGTAELPLSEWFGLVGIGFRARGAINPEDQGGFRIEPPAGDTGPALGARFEVQPAGLRLTQVIAGGAARAAGLSPGDLVVALDGERLTASNLADLLVRAGGDPLAVHYFRRDRLQHTLLPIRSAAQDTCDLWWIPATSLDDATRERREAWLRSSRKDSA